MWIVLLLAGVWAGVQNALAGGGSFITLPVLMLSGMDARAANITSTLALFPGQVTTGLAGRSMAAGTGRLSFRALVAISLAGGGVGALLLLATPPSFFARLLPWLVLTATLLFAWGSLFRKTPDHPASLDPRLAGAAQFAIAVYGGYFGGGIGFLMLAALTIAGMGVRAAGATKNILAAVMNASAVAVLVFSGDAHWLAALALAAGAIAGGLLGASMLKWVNESALRLGVVAIGAALTAGLFVTAR